VNLGFTYCETLPARAEGRALLDWLAGEYRHSTRAEWSERIGRGLVTLDGHAAHDCDLVREGQRLSWARPPWVEAEVPLHFDVVYQDAHLLVVDKPSGLATLPGGGFHQHTLLALVRARDPKWSAVHRLGRGTSGLVIFADALAAPALNRAFCERRIEKRYLARVTGALTPRTICAPIGPVPHPRLGTLHAVSESGRYAQTIVERVEGSLAQVRIVTGRPHQIRIHLAFTGHPLEGDPLYGLGGPRPDAVPSELGYWLRAWELRFEHPVTGEPLCLTVARDA
jgi:23S rRNA pseudouridine1911/1915/1917 synthase